MPGSSQPLTFQEALRKAEHYCAYQERCHYEVRQKLWQLGAHREDIDAILAELVTGNYLNEERFSRLFARSKFNQKRWGRNRIRLELKQKQISEYCIRKGLEEIEEKKYLQGLQEVAEKRWKAEKATHPAAKRQLVAQSLTGRGYEANLVWETLEGFGSR